MPLRIYLDDSADRTLLLTLLRNAGHTVIRPCDAGLSSAADARHLDYAAEHSLIVLTKNPKHFMECHQNYQRKAKRHAGILLIYEDNNRQKDMEPSDIVRAIDKLLKSGIEIASAVHNLNQWR